MKKILFGDLFDNFTWKKKLSLVLIAIIAIALSTNDAPLWYYILFIFGPMFIWWKLDINKEYENCKFLNDED